MDIDEIRRQNLKKLEAVLGAPRIAREAGMSVAQFYNLRDGAKDSKTGKRRGMRKETARRLEHACGVPEGYLDIPNKNTEPEAVTTLTKTDKSQIALIDELNKFFAALDLLYTSLDTVPSQVLAAIVKTTKEKIGVITNTSEPGSPAPSQEASFLRIKAESHTEVADDHLGKTGE